MSKRSHDDEPDGAPGQDPRDEWADVCRLMQEPSEYQSGLKNTEPPGKRRDRRREAADAKRRKTARNTAATTAPIPVARNHANVEFPHPRRQFFGERRTGFQATHLVPYQREVLEWMVEREALPPYHERHHWGGGGILALDMGMGKTPITLALMCMRPPSVVRETQELLWDMRIARTFRHRHLPMEPITLVLAPKAAIHQWVTEAEKFGTGLRVGVVASWSRSVADFQAHIRQFDVVVTTHHAIGYKRRGPKTEVVTIPTGRRTAEEIEHDNRAHRTNDLVDTGLDDLRRGADHVPSVFHSVVWSRVVADEGHVFRNTGTLLYRGLKSLIAPHFWVLTGTPIQNSERDIFTLLAWTCRRGTAHIRLNVDYMMRYCVHRRNRTELDAEFFDHSNIRVINHEIHMSDAESDFYRSIHRQGRIAYQNEMRMQEERGNAFSNTMHHVLTAITRCRQVCVSPVMVDQDWPEPVSTKIFKAAQLIRSVPAGEKVLVFTHFLAASKTLLKCLESMPSRDGTIQRTPMTEAVFALLMGRCHGDGANRGAPLPWDFCTAAMQAYGTSTRLLEFNGSMSTSKQRDVLEQARNDADIKGLILQSTIGATALNLQWANHIIFLDNDWNPSVDLQAIARAHRKGQTRRVHVHRLIAHTTVGELDAPSMVGYDRTVEEHIMAVQQRKINISSELFNETFAEDLIGTQTQHREKATSGLRELADCLFQ
jgi:hypothetical protein